GSRTLRRAVEGGPVMAESRASIGRHPMHPMLVVFPIGLWGAALAFDVVEMITSHPLWGTLAFWNILGGIVGGLLAAVPGFLDYPGVKGREGRIATWHMALNLAAVVLFAVNAFIRLRVSAESPWPLLLSIVGVAGVFISGWLGGELVYVERF